jgi:hypothetical protein
MKRIQVFDWLKMPYPLENDFQDWAEANNDSYIRFYPNRKDNLYDPCFQKRVVNWLLGQGMEIETDEYFYVLIYVSW